MQIPDLPIDMYHKCLELYIEDRNLVNLVIDQGIRAYQNNHCPIPKEFWYLAAHCKFDWLYNEPGIDDYTALCEEITILLEKAKRDDQQESQSNASVVFDLNQKILSLEQQIFKFKNSLSLGTTKQ